MTTYVKHIKIYINNIQEDATVCRYLFTAKFTMKIMNIKFTSSFIVYLGYMF